MEHSRRFGNKAQGRATVQPRDGKSYRAQNIAPHEIAGNATSKRQSLVFGLVFAFFALVDHLLGLGHIRLKRLSNQMQEGFSRSLPGIDLHQGHGYGMNFIAINRYSRTYWFFHTEHYKAQPFWLKVL